MVFIFIIIIITTTTTTTRYRSNKSRSSGNNNNTSCSCRINSSCSGKDSMGSNDNITSYNCRNNTNFTEATPICVVLPWTEAHAKTQSACITPVQRQPPQTTVVNLYSHSRGNPSCLSQRYWSPSLYAVFTPMNLSCGHLHWDARYIGLLEDIHWAGTAKFRHLRFLPGYPALEMAKTTVIAKWGIVCLAKWVQRTRRRRKLP